MEEAEANDVLVEEEDLRSMKRTEQPSDEFEAGKVIRTIPEAGKKREVGTRDYLIY